MTLLVTSQYSQCIILRKSQSLTSVIDYALVDPSLFPKIKHFSLSNMTKFSDHCSIKLSLKTNFEVSTENTYCHLASAPPRFEWSIIHKSA